MRRRSLIIIISMFIVVSIIFILYKNGAISFETYGSDKATQTKASMVEQLEDGCFYVWHNEKADNVMEDLKGVAQSDVFFKCPLGDINWSKNSYINHTIWFTSKNDIEIPTYFPGDEILFVSSTYVPYDGIQWERFADYGYTIGVANMISDNSGHYRIVNNADTGYEGYIYSSSDVSELEKYVNVSNLFLDKIDGLEVREDIVSEGGTIMGLEKDKEYVCEWYTGTYYQDYLLKANIRTFGSMETFTTYEYEFLHSRCISITIPEWLKTGYYYMEAIGFFRYVSEDDAVKYNGEIYTDEINWNDPIIVRDEEGRVIYDPTGEEVYIYNSSSEMESDVFSDIGAEGYEEIENETIVQ